MLPCGDLGANGLYFNLTALAYNLYALLRDTVAGDHVAPPRHDHAPAAVLPAGESGEDRAASGHQAAHRALLERVVRLMREVAPPTTAPPA